MNIRLVLSESGVAAIATALAFLAAVHAPSAFAMTISNGSFETGNTSGPFTTESPGSSDISGWTVDFGSVDYINNYWQAAEGTRSIDLNGNAQGSISQDVTLQANQAYQLSFSLAGNPDSVQGIKTLFVSVVGPGSENAFQFFMFDTTGKTREAMGWVSQSLLFNAVAGGTYTFRFTSLTSGAFGPAVDDISLTAVPLPAAAWLFITALGGLAIVGRRRQMRATTV